MIDEKKLIERLQRCVDTSDNSNFTNGLLSAIDIVNQQSKIGEWIPCSERSPEEHDSVFKRFKGTDKWQSAMFETISNEVEVTVMDEKGERATTTAHTCDGKWKISSCMNLKVIAWKPFSEPYSE